MADIYNAALVNSDLEETLDQFLQSHFLQSQHGHVTNPDAYDALSGDYSAAWRKGSALVYGYNYLYSELPHLLNAKDPVKWTNKYEAAKSHTAAYYGASVHSYLSGLATRVAGVGEAENALDWMVEFNYLMGSTAIAGYGFNKTIEQHASVAVRNWYEAKAGENQLDLDFSTQDAIEAKDYIDRSTDPAKVWDKHKVIIEHNLDLQREQINLAIQSAHGAVADSILQSALILDAKESQKEYEAQLTKLKKLLVDSANGAPVDVTVSAVRRALSDLEGVYDKIMGDLEARNLARNTTFDNLQGTFDNFLREVGAAEVPDSAGYNQLLADYDAQKTGFLGGLEQNFGSDQVAQLQADVRFIDYMSSADAYIESYRLYSESGQASFSEQNAAREQVDVSYQTLVAKTADLKAAMAATLSSFSDNDREYLSETNSNMVFVSDIAVEIAKTDSSQGGGKTAVWAEQMGKQLLDGIQNGLDSAVDTDHPQYEQINEQIRNNAAFQELRTSYENYIGKLKDHHNGVGSEGGIAVSLAELNEKSIEFRAAVSEWVYQGVITNQKALELQVPTIDLFDSAQTASLFSGQQLDTTLKDFVTSIINQQYQTVGNGLPQDVFQRYAESDGYLTITDKINNLADKIQDTVDSGNPPDSILIHDLETANRNLSSDLQAHEVKIREFVHQLDSRFDVADQYALDTNSNVKQASVNLNDQYILALNQNGSLNQQNFENTIRTQFGEDTLTAIKGDNGYNAFQAARTDYLASLLNLSGKQAGTDDYHTAFMQVAHNRERFESNLDIWKTATTTELEQKNAVANNLITADRQMFDDLKANFIAEMGKVDVGLERFEMLGNSLGTSEIKYPILGFGVQHYEGSQNLGYKVASIGDSLFSVGDLFHLIRSGLAEDDGMKKAHVIEAAFSLMGSILYASSDLLEVNSFKFDEGRAPASLINRVDSSTSSATAYAVATSAYMVATSVSLHKIRKALQDDNLTSADRDLLVAEFALKSTSIAFGALEGALTSLNIYGKLGSGSKKLIPIIGTLAQIADMINPSALVAINAKRKYASDIELRGDPSSDLFADLLNEQADVAEDFYDARLATNITTAVVSGVMDMAVPTSGPGMAVDLAGGVAQLIMSMVERGKMKKIVKEHVADMEDIGGGTVEGYYEAMLDEAHEDSLANIQPFVEKLISEGYDQVVAMGTETIGLSTLELGSFVGRLGEVRESAKSFFSMFDGQKWSKTAVEVSQIPGADDQVWLSQAENNEKFVMFSSLLGSSAVSNYTAYKLIDGGTFYDLDLLEIDGWILNDSLNGQVGSATDNTVFDTSGVVNRLEYIDYHLERVLPSGPSDQYLEFAERYELVGTGDWITKELDFTINAHGGNDSLLASVNEISFDGGQDVDVASYATLDTNLMRRGIDVNYSLYDAGTPWLSVVKPMNNHASYAYETTSNFEAENSDSIVTRTFAQKKFGSSVDLTDQLKNVEVLQGTDLGDYINVSGAADGGVADVHQLHGFGGDDVLVGDVNTTVLTGGMGDDFFDPSLALDSAIASYQNNGEMNSFLIDGGKGHDTVIMSASMMPVLKAFHNEALEVRASSDYLFSSLLGIGGGYGLESLGEMAVAMIESPIPNIRIADVEQITFKLEEFVANDGSPYADLYQSAALSGDGQGNSVLENTYFSKDYNDLIDEAFGNINSYTVYEPPVGPAQLTISPAEDHIDSAHLLFLRAINPSTLMLDRWDETPSDKRLPSVIDDNDTFLDGLLFDFTGRDHHNEIAQSTALALYNWAKYTNSPNFSVMQGWEPFFSYLEEESNVPVEQAKDRYGENLKTLEILNANYVIEALNILTTASAQAQIHDQQMEAEGEIGSNDIHVIEGEIWLEKGAYDFQADLYSPQRGPLSASDLAVKLTIGGENVFSGGSEEGSFLADSTGKYQYRFEVDNSVRQFADAYSTETYSLQYKPSSEEDFRTVGRAREDVFLDTGELPYATIGTVFENVTTGSVQQHSDTIEGTVMAGETVKYSGQIYLEEGIEYSFMELAKGGNATFRIMTSEVDGVASWETVTSLSGSDGNSIFDNATLLFEPGESAHYAYELIIEAVSENVDYALAISTGGPESIHLSMKGESIGVASKLDASERDGPDGVTLIGDYLNESFVGSNNGDFIFGGSGHDIIEGGNGSDVLIGADGIDQYIIGKQDGHNLIQNLVEGDSQHDKIVIDFPINGIRQYRMGDDLVIAKETSVGGIVILDSNFSITLPDFDFNNVDTSFKIIDQASGELIVGSSVVDLPDEAELSNDFYYQMFIQAYQQAHQGNASFEEARNMKSAASAEGLQELAEASLDAAREIGYVDRPGVFDLKTATEEGTVVESTGTQIKQDADGDVLLNFSGGNSEGLNLPALSTGNGTGFTFSAYVRHDDDANDVRIFEFGNTQNGSGLNMAIVGNGNDVIIRNPFIKENGSSVMRSIVTKNIIEQGEFHFYTLTADADGLVTLYIDGTEVGHFQTDGEIHKQIYNQGYLGDSGNSNKPSLNGAMSDVRIYDYALNEKQVSALYEIGQSVVNDAPDAVIDVIEVDGLYSSNIDLLANDSDPESDNIELVAVDGSSISEPVTVISEGGRIATLIKREDGTIDVDLGLNFTDLREGEVDNIYINYHIFDGINHPVAANAVIHVNGIDAIARTDLAAQGVVLGAVIDMEKVISETPPLLGQGDEIDLDSDGDALLTFQGLSDQGIDLPELTDIEEFSFSAFVRLDDLTADYQPIFGVANSDYSLSLNTHGGLVKFYATQMDPIDQESFSSHNAVVQGQFQHWVVNMDKYGFAKMYVDGVLVNSGQMPAMPSGSNFNSVSIAQAFVENQHFKGAMSDIQFFDYALNDAQVTSLFNGGPSILNEAPDLRTEFFKVDGYGTHSFDIMANAVDPDGDILELMDVDGYTPGSTFTLQSEAGRDVDVTINFDGSIMIDLENGFLNLEEGALDLIKLEYAVSDGVDKTSSAHTYISVDGLDSVKRAKLSENGVLHDPTFDLNSADLLNSPKDAYTIHEGAEGDILIELNSGEEIKHAFDLPDLVHTSESGFTFSAYVRFDDLSVPSLNVFEFSNDADKLMLQRLGDSSSLQFVNIVNGSAMNRTLVVENVLEEGVFQHITVTVDRNGFASIYLEGREVSSLQLPGPIPPQTFTTMLLGAAMDESNTHFEGAMTDVKVFDVALSAGEVEDLFDVRQSYINQAPDLLSDSYEVSDGIDHLQVGVAEGLLANDTDSEGDLLQVVSVNGQDISAPITVTSAQGREAIIEVGADGTFDVTFGENFTEMRDGASDKIQFNYTVSDGVKGNVTQSAEIAVTGENFNHKIAEFGQEQVGVDWTQVQTDIAFDDPVVIAFASTPNGSLQRVDTRIQNVTADGFEIKLQGIGDLPDDYSQNVNYMVIEAGVHQLSNGLTIEAGTFGTSQVNQNTRQDLIEEVAFQNTDESAAGGPDKFVFTSVNSYNDGRFVSGRTFDHTSEGFKYAFAAAENDTTGHLLETVGWLAIENNPLEFNELIHASRKYTSGTKVDLDVREIPSVFGQIASLNIKDPISLVIDENGRPTVREDQTRDDEMGHGGESVHVLSLGYSQGWLEV